MQIRWLQLQVHKNHNLRVWIQAAVYRRPIDNSNKKIFTQNVTGKPKEAINMKKNLVIPKICYFKKSDFMDSTSIKDYHATTKSDLKPLKQTKNWQSRPNSKQSSKTTLHIYSTFQKKLYIDNILFFCRIISIWFRALFD